jgi:hypothetical protein
MFRLALEYGKNCCCRLEVTLKVLSKLKIARIIGKAVWDQRGDIRFQLAGWHERVMLPEEVERILSTMMRYGDMKV